MVPILIVLISVMVPIVFLIASAVKRVQERKCLHLERIKALEMGLTTLPAALAGPEVDEVKKVKKSSGGGGGGSALHGTVWTAVGLGLFVATIAARAQFESQGARDFFLVVQVWSIPALFVGLGLLIYSAVTGKQQNKAETKAPAVPSSPPVPRQPS
jgi:hypothetical protein